MIPESANHGSPTGESIGVVRRVIESIIDHARREAPLECCGLLAARDGIIDAVFPARNLETSRIAFLLDPADHFAALKQTRRDGRDIVGAYHSHPRSPAIPSPTDLAEAHYEAFLYVIVSLSGPQPDVRAYRLVPGPRFENTRLEILDCPIGDSGLPIRD